MPTPKSEDAKQINRCRNRCRARCCRYITIHIPAPRRKADFDELGWFLAHENIAVYFNDRRWRLEVRSSCKHLTPRNLCAIYENRPLVCRVHDADGCEYPSPPKHDLQFESQEQFDSWREKRKARERQLRRRRTARPQPPR